MTKSYKVGDLIVVEAGKSRQKHINYYTFHIVQLSNISHVMYHNNINLITSKVYIDISISNLYKEVNKISH